MCVIKVTEMKELEHEGKPKIRKKIFKTKRIQQFYRKKLKKKKRIFLQQNNEIIKMIGKKLNTFSKTKRLKWVQKKLQQKNLLTCTQTEYVKDMIDNNS